MGDFTVPLATRTAQIDSPLEAQARGLSLQQMAQGVQMNAAKLKEEQLKAKAAEEDRRDWKTIQDAYGSAVQNTKPGQPFDYQALRNKIAPSVNPRNLAIHDKTVLEHVTGMSKWDADKIKNDQSQTEAASKHIDAVLSVRPGDNSPEAVAARAAEWAKQVTLAKAKGLDPQNEYDPTHYPGDEALNTIDVGLKGTKLHLAEAKQAQDIASEKAEAERKKRLEAPQLTIEEQKAADAQRVAATSQLVAAGARSWNDYDALLNSFKPEIARSFPLLPKPDDPSAPLDEEVINNLQQIGMTPTAQATSMLTKQQRETQAEANNERKRHNQAMESINAARASRERGETANSQAVNRRQWERELNKLKEEEEVAVAARTNLENALNSGGKLYADEKGTTKAMTTASKDESLTADALGKRMKAQYETLTNRLKRITADKNSLGESLGMQIGVPTPKLHQGFDADLQRIKSIGQAAPTAGVPVPPPAASPTPAAQPQAPAKQPAAGQTVKMKAPNGQEQDVPADQVGHFKKLGAKVVVQR